MHKPQPAVLAIWRWMLVLCTLPPAFLISMFFRPGSMTWILLSALWVLVFLFFYLCYLPRRYQKRSYTLREGRIEVHGGVIFTRVLTMPLTSIQFVSLQVSPLERHYGLASLVVTAAGGRIFLSGLRRSDAEALTKLLPGDWNFSK